LIEDFERLLAGLKLHHTRLLGSALKKPLLLLLVLSKIYKGEALTNEFRFAAIEKELAELIKDAGGRVTSPKPEQPFYHMTSSPLWSLTSDLPLPENRRSTIPISVLRDISTVGSLNEEWFGVLRQDPEVCLRCVDVILNKWWSETLHSDIRGRLGLPDGYTRVMRRKRDPAFVEATLRNYRYRCAVCGFDLVLNRQVVGLDAAHIHWHAHGGPDSLENGLALCKLHHWALDKGLFTIVPDRLKIEISPRVVARCEVSQNALTEFEATSLQPHGVSPGGSYLQWHRENRFMP
jgi:putative restriction endonuclease